MMKSMKQIADEIRVDKQKVYRYIRKNNITEACQDAGTKIYDEAAEMLIKEYFSKDNASDDINQTVSESLQSTITETLVDMLKLELECKNRLITDQQETIRDLTSIIATKDTQILELTSSLNAAQALHAGTIRNQISAEQQPIQAKESQAEEADVKRRRWWQIWKAKTAQA